MNIDHSSRGHGPRLCAILVLALFLPLAPDVAAQGSSPLLLLPDAMVAAEGGPPATYTVALNGVPTKDVVVSIAFDSDQLSVQPSTLTFAENAPPVPQAVHVTALADDAPEGPHTLVLAHAMASEDPAYNLEHAGQTQVLVVDETRPAGPPALVTIAPRTVFVSTNQEPLQQAAYTVTLAAPPEEPVRVLPHARDGTVTVEPAVLTFAAGETGPKVFTVTADVTPSADSTEDLVQHQVLSMDGRYDGFDADDVRVVLQRNPFPANPPRGFVAHVDAEGAVAGPSGLTAAPDADGDLVFHATVYEGEPGATYDAVTEGRYVLRIYWGDPEVQTIDRWPEHNGDGLPDGCTEFPCIAVDGRFTWSVPRTELPPAEQANGYNVQIHKISAAGEWVDSSHLFLPKDLLLAEGGKDAAPAADAVDAGGYTPLFLVPEEVAGDGFFVRITPQTALRTNAGTMMEANIFGNYRFEACAFDATGAPYAITDYRLEILGITADDPAGAGPVYATGSYTSGGQPLDRVLEPADHLPCVYVDVPRSAVRGDLVYDQSYHVSFWVPFGSTGKHGFYSESVNGLFQDGTISPEDADLADNIDHATRTGVMLVPRKGAPAQGDLTMNGLTTALGAA